MVPIGRPFANSCIYLLDAHGEPVLPGMPGELCIGGHGVVRGYLGQPGLTAQRFGADPFRPGMRLYRTGDQARRLADGTLELLGRMDQQRKLRGFRIEPGEIEAVLATHPAVDAAVVGLGAPSGGESRLVAWIVYREPGGLAGDLRDWLQGRLPAHLVPAVFLALPALPLTPNGKVDRAALAASVLEPEPATGSVPGRTPLEELLCGLFAEVLGLPAFGVHEDFFARGGHSLLATRLVARIRAALAAELPLRAVFESPTPAGVARYIAAGANGMPALPAALPRRPAGLALLPLSPPQQRLWFLHQLEPASTAYHLHWTLRLAGELDAVALEAAVNDLVARHEALRTCFVVAAGTPWQQVEPRLSRTVGLEDYSEGALHRCLTVPFDLARGPLLRVALLREADDAHVLVVVLHHIVADGWSLAVLGRELGLLYGARRAGRPAGLAALPVQYGDYALWLAGRLGSDEMDGQLRYWQGQLAGLPPRLPLPRDQVGGDAAAASAWLTRTLPAACLMPLKELARGEGATLFMVLLAGFAVVLGRRAGTDDVAVGTPVAGRGRTELEGLIGFFVNTLVLRTDLSGDPTFRELLARVKAMALAAYAHAELPFEKLVEVLNPPRSLAHGPLVQVQIVLHNQPRAELCFPGVNAEPLPVASTDAKFDLSLHLAEASGGLDLTLSWRADRYGRERMAALLDAYADVLRAVATQPALRLSSLCPPKELQPRRQPRGAAPKGPRDPSPAELPARVAPAPPGESRPEPCAAREGELTDEVEAVLQSIWCELLRQDTVGVDEDFFAVGGHSLLATRLVARISDQLNVELPLLRVFQTPSIRGLARAVCAAPAAGTRPAHAPIPRLPRRPGG